VFSAVAIQHHTKFRKHLLPSSGKDNCRHSLVSLWYFDVTRISPSNSFELH